jgi:Flp pilus assembly protein TadG
VLCALLLALVALAQAVAERRAAQDRALQAAAAREAATRLTTLAERTKPSVSDLLTAPPAQRATVQRAPRVTPSKTARHRRSAA